MAFILPSNARDYANDFSEAALSNNGYTLRNFLTMRAYAEVIRELLMRPDRP
jgi:hypothetical protein